MINIIYMSLIELFPMITLGATSQDGEQSIRLRLSNQYALNWRRE